MSTGNGRPKTGPSNVTAPAIPRLVHPVPDVPVGADAGALAANVSTAITKLEAAERSFNKTADILVNEMKEVRSDVSNLKDDVAKITGVLLRVESKVDALATDLGQWPAGEDMVLRLQRESVRDASPEAIAAHDEKLRVATEGTGIKGFVSRSVANDRRLSDKDLEFERRLADLAKSSAKEAAVEAAEGVVEDAKDVAKTGNRRAVVQGATVTVIAAAIVSIIVALGGAEGLARIIHGPAPEVPPAAAPAP